MVYSIYMPKKQNGYEKLARMVQAGFSEVHEEIGTVRGEIGSLRNEVHAEFKSVRREMEMMRNEMATKDDLHKLRQELLGAMDRQGVKYGQAYNQLHEWVKEIDERLTRLEDKKERARAR